MYKGIVIEDKFGFKCLRLIKDEKPVVEFDVSGIDNIRIDKETGKILISVEFEVDSLEI